MIRKDDLGNLYTFSDNGGYFVIKNIPKVKGTLHIVFCGDTDVEKNFELSGQESVMIKLSTDDIESIGAGRHIWYADLIVGKERDTIIYKTITVVEKEF